VGRANLDCSYLLSLPSALLLEWPQALSPPKDKSATWLDMSV